MKKIKKTILIGVVFLILVFIFVNAQTGDDEPEETTPTIERNCVNLTILHNITRTLYYNTPNCTEMPYTKPECIRGYRNVTRSRIKKECNPYIQINNVKINYREQGYNCKKKGQNIICDSCSDGNCDGICDPRGGETCIKITRNGKVIHKNGATTWKETFVPVKRLNTKVRTEKKRTNPFRGYIE